MQKGKAYHFLFVGLLLFLSTITVNAQDAKIDLFGGYSYGTNNLGCNLSFGCESVGVNGDSAAAACHFNKFVGLEANFSGHNGILTTFSIPSTASTNAEKNTLSHNIYNYPFGPNLSLP